MSHKIDARKANFKKTVTNEDSRRHREEHAVQIRKDKKTESVAKRRQQVSAAHAADGGAAATGPPPPGVEHIPILVQGVHSNDEAIALEATAQFRKMLSIERNPPIDAVIASNVVPRLISFLQYSSNPKLQFEAAWAVTNIASGTSEHTRFVVENGAVPLFVALMSSPSEDVREQAVWALGNIAGDSPVCRDLVLGAGGLMPLLAHIVPQAKPSFLRNATWTLSNLCRGKPQPSMEHMRSALPTLAQLIHSNDADVVTDALWALSYLSDGDNDRVQAVVDAGVTSRLVELLLSTSHAVQTPALRTIGNIVTGNDVQTQAAINAGALHALLALMGSSRKATKKEATWSVSNVCAGNHGQIQAVVDANLIQMLVQLVTSAEYDVRKEAVWALSNATSGGSPEQIAFLVQCGVLPALVHMVDPARVRDTRVIVVALEGIENILKAGDAKFGSGTNPDGSPQNPFVLYAEEAGVLDPLVELQDLEDKYIVDKAVTLLYKYFHGDEEEEGEGGEDGGVSEASEGNIGDAPGQTAEWWANQAAAAASGVAPALTPQQHHFGFGIAQPQQHQAQGAALTPPGGAPAAGWPSAAAPPAGGFQFQFQ